MPVKRIAVRVAVWTAVSLAVMASLPYAIAQTSAVTVAVAVAVVVVVNEKNPVTNVSTQELRKLFAGEKRSWTGGLTVKLFVRAPGAHERTTLLKLLGMTESEYKQYWSAQVFRGEAQAEPVALFSNGMQKEALAAFPGAVALVSFEDVKRGMKVVKVDGHSPNDPEYPLH
jgi:ABC-type phosphate transport system substrate-binding protein